MKKISLVLSFTLLLCTQIFSQSTKEVLFIGNSYTGYNNLPSMVSEMATSTGDELIYDAHTPGGQRFLHHAVNSTALAKISSKSWNYVVLQGQSQETSLSENQMQNEVYPFAQSLCESIRANDTCSTPLFYMTWGRENGDDSRCATSPWVCTYEGMDDAIRETYTYMAQENKTEVAPVGAVWRYLRENHPEIGLYSSDGSHPSLAGSYAAGCAFYTIIFEKDPSLITWNSTLSEEIAETIRSAAKIVAYDDLNNWNFTSNSAVGFSEAIDDKIVTFTNTTEGFESITWDFGDGNTSDDINPVHTYEDYGEYTVLLTVESCGQTKIKTKELSVFGLLSIEEEDEPIRFLAFPNPSSSELTIELDKEYQMVQLEVLDLSGKIILVSSHQNKQLITLNTDSLRAGMYLLNMTLDDVKYTTKIVVE